MTTHAVGEVADALFPVFLGNFALIVLVATETGVGVVAVGVAGGTGPSSATMVHGEAVRTVVRGRPPGAG